MGGTFGRIAVRRRIFERLGGYDEDTAPAGCHDTDLIARITMTEPVKGQCGRRHVRVTLREFCQAIPNMKTETVQHTSSRLKWGRMDLENRALLHKRRME